MTINPVWEPAANKMVGFMTQPISGNPGDLTYGTILVVIVLMMAVYVGMGGKL